MREKAMKAKSKGYTLAELLVVMFIIAVIATASVPSFLKYTSGSRLRGSAQDIVAALNAARRIAITQRQSRSVTIYMNDPPPGDTGPEVGRIENAVSFYETADMIRLEYMARNIYLIDASASSPPTPSQDTYICTFNARGGMSMSPSTVVLRLVGPDGRYINLTTVAATGHVKMGAMNP